MVLNGIWIYYLLRLLVLGKGNRNYDHPLGRRQLRRCIREAVGPHTHLHPDDDCHGDNILLYLPEEHYKGYGSGINQVVFSDLRPELPPEEVSRMNISGVIQQSDYPRQRACITAQESCHRISGFLILTPYYGLGILLLFLLGNRSRNIDLAQVLISNLLSVFLSILPYV